MKWFLSILFLLVVLVLASFIFIGGGGVKYSGPFEEPTLGGEAASNLIRASRIFAGPSQYPPRSFAAYGLVAFPSRATSADLERHINICTAYVGRLPNSLDLTSTPVEEQMVTVWPVSNEITADLANLSETIGEACEVAVDDYDQIQALTALKQAELSGHEFVGRGPWLLAWAPGIHKGNDSSAVLISDLSHVDSIPEALSIFSMWSDDIEADPSLWKNGFSNNRFREKLRLWVDKHGEAILNVFKLS